MDGLFQRLKPYARVNEHDISKIVEVLAPYAYKWREIGTALGFTHHELNNIQSNLTIVVQGPIGCLTAMLNEWVQWTKDGPHDEYATFGDLCLALASQTVNLGEDAEDVSSKIGDILWERWKEERRKERERERESLREQLRKSVKRKAEERRKGSYTVHVPDSHDSSDTSGMYYYGNTTISRKQDLNDSKHHSDWPGYCLVTVDSGSTTDDDDDDDYVTCDENEDVSDQAQTKKGLFSKMRKGVRKMFGAAREMTVGFIKKALKTLSLDVMVTRKYKKRHDKYTNRDVARWWFEIWGDEAALKEMESQWEREVAGGGWRPALLSPHCTHRKKPHSHAHTCTHRTLAQELTNE